LKDICCQSLANHCANRSEGSIATPYKNIYFTIITEKKLNTHLHQQPQPATMNPGDEKNVISRVSTSYIKNFHLEQQQK
jgi:hypothetical protein